MFSGIVLAQEIEREIGSALTPMGPFFPQPFPWGQVLLAVGICAIIFFFFLIFLPKLAANMIRFGGVMTLILAVSLSLLLPFTLYALREPTKVLLKAAPGVVPENAAVTSVTAGSFTVEWRTPAMVVGLVKYGEAPDRLEFFALDEKGNVATTSHRITVKNLRSQTRYYFEVISGQLRFNDNGQPLEVKTP